MPSLRVDHLGRKPLDQSGAKIDSRRGAADAQVVRQRSRGKSVIPIVEERICGSMRRRKPQKSISSVSVCC